MGAFVEKIVVVTYAGACTEHMDWTPEERSTKERAQEDVATHEEEMH